MNDRLIVRAGSMGRAVGALDVIDRLRAVLPDATVVEAGSDGAAWAAPVIAADGEDPAAAPAGDDPVGVAHAVRGGQADPTLRAYLAAQERRLLGRAGCIDPASLDDARATGAYDGLRAALSGDAAAALAIVERSGLRGRGGAYFPVHLKWRAALDAVPRNGLPLLVINAEEGEPGVFKDRVLMEADPHRLVEGIAIAAYALGAHRAYVYINGQADLSAERVAAAIAAARSAGVLGDPALDIEIRRGAGGYVCGEETVILESIEGHRAVPRLRPPFPTERGLFGRPTVINNVETIANLPDIFRFGPDWFRAAGPVDAPGTKLISLSGALDRPGLVEVPMGTPIGDILDIGGARHAAGVVAGGPSGGLLPAAKFGLPIAPGFLDPAGAVLGSGGMVVFNDTFGPADVLAAEAAYNAHESCGKCTPCREGGERLVDALVRLRQGDAAARRDIDELVTLMRSASLCGLGQMAVSPITSALQDFPQEIGAAP